MKHLLSIVCLMFWAQWMFGQKETVLEKGVVSYASSQNVYVKFSNTTNINKGDTLFSNKGDQWLPGLLVKDKSSTSVVCSALQTDKAKVGDEFYSKSLVEKQPEKVKPDKIKNESAGGLDSTGNPRPLVTTPAHDNKDDVLFKQKIKGRISAASYSNFSGADIRHRMRYTLTFQGNNLKNSRFSTDNYITFRHTIGEWQKVKDNFNNALKVYSLSVSYDLDKFSRITLGRKINLRISSMGAIDGLQVEKGLKRHFLVGAIAGSRPDYTNYGLNLHLFQAGAYIGHSTRNNTKSQESTLAFVEQRNHLKTDRRFVYFQHSNALLKNIFLFSSFEIDLFQNVNNVVTNTPSLTNLLLSFRYNLSKKLSLSAAYDNRKNIIYYESYKSYIDQLIEDETRQGLRFGGNYRFSKLASWGCNASWRFQKNNANLSTNFNSYLNFNRLPWIKATTSLSVNILQTNYLNSKVYGLQLSREIVRSKLNGELYFRMVSYDYKNNEAKIKQEIAGIDLSWNITRKLAFYLYYEGTFDKQRKPCGMFNSRIIQRF